MSPFFETVFSESPLQIEYGRRKPAIISELILRNEHLSSFAVAVVL